MGLLDKIFGIDKMKRDISEVRERLSSIEEKIQELERLSVAVNEIEVVKKELALVRKDIENIESSVDNKLDEQRKFMVKIVEDIVYSYPQVFTQQKGSVKKVDEEEILELYKKGTPISQIAKMLNISRQTVYNKLKKMGVNFRESEKGTKVHVSAQS